MPYSDLLMVTANGQNINGMITINQASADWLAGRMDTGTYFDILDHFGINAYLHVNPVKDLTFSSIARLDILT